MYLKELLLIRTVFILFLFLVSSVVGFQTESSSEKIWWQIECEKGMELINTGDIEAAKEQFKSILKQDKNIAQAHFGLGLVEVSRNPGSRQAIREFEKAIRINRNFAEAYFQIGMVYKNQKTQLFKAKEFFQKAVRAEPAFADAWYELAKVEEELWPSGGQISLFAKAVKASPGNDRIYKEFVQAARWFNREKEVFNTLDILIERFPKEPRYLLDKARFLQLTNEEKKSLKLLETIETKFPNYSPSEIALVKAQNYFNIDSSDAGLHYYRKGLYCLSDTTEASLYFEDVRYIMNSSEYSLLQVLPLDSLPKFYERFWIARDPNLSTIKNERIPEHYQRLLFASRYFHRYISDPKILEYMHESDHPYAGYNMQGNKLLEESNLSHAVPLNFRYLDDLGIIYVRHGDPDMQVSSLSGIPDYIDLEMQSQPGTRSLQFRSFREDRSSIMWVPRPVNGESLLSPGYLNNVPMNWSWKYFEKNNRPEMVFHFKKYGSTLGWIIETIPYSVAQREEFDSKFYQLGMESFSSEPFAGIVSELCDEIRTQSLQDVKVALNSESTVYSYNAEPLVFPIQILNFKGKNNKTLVEIYYLIDGEYVDLDTTAHSNKINLNQFWGIFNHRWDVISSINRTHNIPMNKTVEEWKAPLAVVDFETFNFSPGICHFEIHIKDNVSQRLGVYKGEYPVKDFSGDQLVLSDVLLSDAIEPGMRNSKYVKENISYRPHMFSPYILGSQVGIYFEIYNLSKDAAENSHFRVSCTLQTDEKNEGNPGKLVSGFFKSVLGQNPDEVSTSYDYSSELSDEKIYLNFQIEEKKPGKYKLEIEVRDLNTNVRTTNRVGFTIID